MGFRSGYVAILGRPNVGKSTLLNRVLGQKISIVSEKPQTTRNRIVGIHTTEAAQVVFLDTPGVHKGRDTFNKWMVDQALSTISEVDVALFVVELDLDPGPGDRHLAQAIGAAKNATAILVGNKADLVPKEKRDKALDRYLALGRFSASGAISAETGEGVDKLLGAIVDRLPEGPKYYPEDQLTDRPERFLAAEIVREKLFLLTRQEIPYATAVVTDDFKEEPALVRIECTIFVEKESQKGMVIGKQGSMLKKVGTEARLELERFLATKVMLQLWVKVKPDWTTDPKALRSLGYVAE